MIQAVARARNQSKKKNHKVSENTAGSATSISDYT